MLSLDNSFTESDVTGFLQRVRHAAEAVDESAASSLSAVCVEKKIDGISVSLRYTHGKLEWCATRGDGTRGEDVTAAVRLAEGVPASLPAEAPPLLEVRGELCMPRKALSLLNAEREEAGLPQLANARNATAGLVNQNDANEDECRRFLRFLAYDAVGEADSGLSDSHMARMEQLASWGVSVVGPGGTGDYLDGGDLLFWHRQGEATR